MLRIRCLSAAAVVAIASLWNGSSAQAQWPWLAYSPLSGSPAEANLAFQSRTPPYFAVHPPVYYSGAISRVSYGSSPYAFSQPLTQYRSASYFGQVESQSPGIMIENPHYTAEHAGTAGPMSEPMTTGPMPTLPLPAPPMFVPPMPPMVLPPAATPVVPPTSGVLPAPAPNVKPTDPKPTAPNIVPLEAGKTVINPYVSPSRS